MHLPDAATSASKGTLRASIGSAANELIASTISDRPWRCTTAAIAGSGLRMPVDVSQWMSADVRDRGVLRQRAVDVVGRRRHVVGGLEGRAAPAQHPGQSCQALAVGAVDQHQHVAVARHQRVDGGLDRERAAALQRHADVRVGGVDDRRASRARTVAVTALKAASQEPQSRSIAALVASDVVSGPGVRRIGSREGRAMMIPCRGCYRVGAARRQPCVAAHQPRLGDERQQRDDARRDDDQRRHRRGRAERARLVELDDRDRRQHRLGRIQEHHRRNRRHRVDEVVAADVDDRRQAHRNRHAPERLVERHLERRRHRLELVVELLQRGDRRQVARRVEVDDRRQHEDRHRAVEDVERIGRVVEEQDVADAEHQPRHRHRQHRLQLDQRPQKVRAARLFQPVRAGKRERGADDRAPARPSSGCCGTRSPRPPPRSRRCSDSA